MGELAQGQLAHRGRGEAQEARAEDVAEPAGLDHEPVVLHPLQQAIRRREREARLVHDIGERTGAAFDGRQDGHEAIEQLDRGAGRSSTKRDAFRRPS